MKISPTAFLPTIIYDLWTTPNQESQSLSHLSCVHKENSSTVESDHHHAQYHFIWTIKNIKLEEKYFIPFKLIYGTTFSHPTVQFYFRFICIANGLNWCSIYDCSMTLLREQFWSYEVGWSIDKNQICGFCETSIKDWGNYIVFYIEDLICSQKSRVKRRQVI